ncbi:MAG: cation diffusion facilitator family transporter [Actinomycetota bacterium]
MSESESRAAVVAALVANVGIAVAKVIGFVITGSASLLAEAGHSVADSGNQGVLLFGQRRSRKDPNAEHPFGHARERFFSAFVVAVILFTAGAGFAAREGYDKLVHPHDVESPIVAIVILLVAMGLEAFSLRTAVRAANHVREGRGWWRFIRESKAADLNVVLLEDTAALLGLVLAFLGVVLAAITGDGAWDGVGTIAIAVLLAAVAAVLAVETKSLLIGEAASQDEIAEIRNALAAGDVFQSVIHLRTEHRGPDEILVAAKVAVPAGTSSDQVARAIDEAEARIRAALPAARYIFIEPDLRRED